MIRTYTQEDPIGLAGGLNLYGFANGDPVNFSDPFGLSAGPCIWILEPGRCTAALLGGLFRGLTAARNAAVAPLGVEAQPLQTDAQVMQEMAFAGPVLGLAGRGAAGAGGRGFVNNRVLNNHRVGGNRVSVDAEFGGSGVGQVHVHIGGDKIMLRSLDDLQNLPRSVRSSAEVQKAVEKAFEWLEKAAQ